MNSALLRFYGAVALTVILLFASVNQLYQWLSADLPPVIDTEQILEQVQQRVSAGHDISCTVSTENNCAQSLFVLYPKSLWHGPVQPGQVFTLKDSQGHLMICNESSRQELLCLQQQPEQKSPDISVNLADIFLLLLLLSLFFVSRNLFKDMDILRQSALKEIHQGCLPKFSLSPRSYLMPLAISLQNMNDRIEQLTRLQREMADTICHEIKTPLARLKFITYSLTPARLEHYREQLQDNLHDIEENIYDYLQLAQQNFRHELNLSQLPIATLVQDSINKYSDSTEHQIQLRHCNTQTANADPKLLQRALDNLLANALRHCSSNVWIDIERKNLDVCISVADDGPGWGGAAKSSSLVAQHHGLGLAIVRRVAEQHGGQLVLGNLPGGGAKAVLILPQEQLN